ncbi:MAG: hypothetical protein LYZ70_05705 [Nitrososphaerales archaeon]|nr:hypothetical protein [Nitrososphaerales archaeon]
MRDTEIEGDRGLFGFLAAVVKNLKSLLSSLRGTLFELAGALRARSGSRIVALISEGSPLESFFDSLLGLVFWVLILAPLVFVPALYLLLSFMR